MTYMALQITSQKIIERYGRSVVLRRNNEGTYNPATDTITGASTTDVSVIAVFTDFEQDEIDGTLIVRGDKKAVIAAGSLNSPPENNDILIDGSDQYRIVQLMAVQPGDTALIYKVQVRK